jgi:hypothetical protein
MLTQLRRNLWNWLPRIARTIRVPPSMMLASWMGTDFTNDDLVKESSLRKDFEPKVEQRSDDPPGWWIGLTVKPGVVGRWARIELLVGDDDLPERHFDLGRLARALRRVHDGSAASGATWRSCRRTEAHRDAVPGSASATCPRIPSASRTSSGAAEEAIVTGSTCASRGGTSGGTAAGPRWP